MHVSYRLARSRGIARITYPVGELVRENPDGIFLADGKQLELFELGELPVLLVSRGEHWDEDHCEETVEGWTSAAEKKRVTRRERRANLLERWRRMQPDSQRRAS
jgi:hypothetical protein